jgi:hypothetical protein
MTPQADTPDARAQAEDATWQVFHSAARAASGCIKRGGAHKPETECMARCVEIVARLQASAPPAADATDRIEAKLDEILQARVAICVWCGHEAESIKAAREHDCECKASPVWQNAATLARECKALKTQYAELMIAARRCTDDWPAEMHEDGAGYRLIEAYRKVAATHNHEGHTDETHD